MAEPSNTNSQPGTGETTNDADAMAAKALSDAEASVAELEQAMADAGAMDMPDFSSDTGAESMPGIDMLGDVELHVTIELGRTRMLVEDVLRLSSGSVVELDKLAGDPVDVYVNDCLIARGEVLVLNDNFCIRISEIVENLEERAGNAAVEQAKSA